MRRFLIQPIILIVLLPAFYYHKLKELNVNHYCKRHGLDLNFLYFCKVIKQFVHKIFSMLLALLVLFSTVSFTIEKHFCGDVLVDVSVFAEAQKCGMEALEMATRNLAKKSCCKDEVECY